MDEECCVAGCSNTEENEEVLFHKFPRNSDLKGIWMKIIPLKLKISEFPIICSDHFPDTDYKDIKGKKILNRLAIPSIFENNPEQSENSINSDTHSEKHGQTNKKNNATECNDNISSVVSKNNDILNRDNDNVNKDKDNSNGELKKDNVKANEDKNKTNENNVKLNQDIDKLNIDHDKINEDNNKLNEDLDKVKEDNKINKGNNKINENSDKVNLDIDKVNKEDDKINEDNNKVKQDIDKADKNNDKIVKDIDNINKSNYEKNKIVSDFFKNSSFIGLETLSNTKTHCYMDGNIKNCTNENIDCVTKDKEDIELDLEDTIPSFMILDSNPIPACRGSPVNFAEVPIVEDTAAMLDVPECEVERMEVSIDPSMLMVDMPVEEIELSDGDSVDLVPADPVSLLTSSDEDEVIFQEPKYDIVEVSDETDEEDRPLVKLVNKPNKLNDENSLNEMETNIITKIIKKVNEFICVICQFRTERRSSFFDHINLHSGCIQKCYTCSFSSGNLTSFKKHLTQHAKEQRFKCHLCAFKAKHHMSLVYHLQEHVVYNCKKCEFRTFDSEDFERHNREHNNMENNEKYVCRNCKKSYKTKLGLKKHYRKCL